MNSNIDNDLIFNDLIEGADDIFFWSIIKNGDDEEDVFYSENILAITGYTEKEIKQMPERRMSIIFEEDLSEVKKKLGEFSADPAQKYFKLIYRIVTKEKHFKWIKDKITVKRDNEGRVIRMSGLVVEINNFILLQEELREDLNLLRQLNISKDKFISMLSHDLRAPFTSILGFAEILMNEPNLSNQERMEYLNYIHESSQNQLQLISYLLDWSRLQTGRIKIEPQRLNAQDVVFNCVSSLTGNAIRKNIEIKVEIKDTINVEADEKLLTQVVTNLLSNAIKFSPENKSIIISAAYFNNDMIEFIVKDEGTGISDANKTKLFRIEKMFSTEGTKGEKGTGLGLSLVKEIIEKHRGNIWFYSEIR